MKKALLLGLAAAILAQPAFAKTHKRKKKVAVSWHHLVLTHSSFQTESGGHSTPVAFAGAPQTANAPRTTMPSGTGPAAAMPAPTGGLGAVGSSAASGPSASNNRQSLVAQRRR